jgi:hypothetical protein
MSEESQVIVADSSAGLNGLPTELRHRILESCDEFEDLLVICQLNSDWYGWTMPLIWGEIDFMDYPFSNWDLPEMTRRFFVHCEALMKEMPDRWPGLAGRVRKLCLGRLIGVNIVHEEWDGGNDAAYYMEQDESEKSEKVTVFDIIAQFINLETLSVYIKNWWDDLILDSTCKALAEGMKNLKSLEVGGMMSREWLTGLLTNAEKLEHLSCINLHSLPGQDNGPDGVTILSDISDSNRFRKLKSLYLCKLADLDGSDDWDDDWDPHQFASKMRWKFPREAEVKQLEEWAALLKSCSNTLEEATLENRYLCGGSYKDDRDIDPGGTHPADYGAFSIRESQRLLFPALSLEWPKLEKLVLIGMGRVDDIHQAVQRLEPRVQVEQRLAGHQVIAGDCTPDEITTPQRFRE